MSSLVRRIQRRWKRVLAEYERPAQVFKENEDGSLEVLHSTKGWRHVSKKRLKKGKNDVQA